MNGRACGVAVAAFAVAALAGRAAESKRYGFDKPLVIVAEEVDAYFSGEGNAMTKEGLEQYADRILAGGKVTHVIWCPVAGRANYASKATEPIWAGLDQPGTVWGIEKKTPGVACSGTTPEEMAANRRWAENAKKLADAGIDPYRVWIDRTHAKGAQAWLSIRMTDLQYCYVANYFRTPSIFAKSPFLLSDAGENGGGSPNFCEPEVREWLKKVVAEVADRYLDADGFEFDFVSGCDTPVTRLGSKSFGEADMRGYISTLARLTKDVTRNPKHQSAIRVVPESNELGVRNLPAGGTSIVIPYLDSRRAAVQTATCREWHELDRVSPRVMPGIAVAQLGADEVAGWVSWMRGWDFPGIVLTHVEKAAPAVRDGVFSGALVGWDRTVRGPRRLRLNSDAHLRELEGGYADRRARYPWKLDRSWTYEFALQDGSVAEKGVRAVVTYRGGSAPERILLNGYASQSSVRNKDEVTYVFDKGTILNFRNHLHIPAQTGADVATVAAAVVEIDK